MCRLAKEKSCCKLAMARFTEALEKEREKKALLLQLKGKENVTVDGHKVMLHWIIQK